MRFYFAGKVAKNDWRHNLVEGLRDAVYACMDPMQMGGRVIGASPDTVLSYGHANNIMPARGLVLRKSIMRQHDYVGPFFISCDHGGFHGENQHGVRANIIKPVIERGRDEEYDPYSGSVGCCANAGIEGCFDAKHAYALDGECDQRREEAFVRSMDGIRYADVIYAHLADFTAFGTLVELGAARALGKEIWLTYSSEIPDDLWFALQTDSLKKPLLCDDPVKGFYTLYEQRRTKIESFITTEEQEKKREYNSFRLTRLKYKAILEKTSEVANKGSAMWRELLTSIVVEPLTDALNDHGVELMMVHEHIYGSVPLNEGE